MSNIPTIEELVRLREVEEMAIMQKSAARKVQKKLHNNLMVLCLFCNHKAETNTILALTSLLMSLGFLFGDGVNQNYDLLYEVLPASTWAAIFFLYSGVKLASCVTKVQSSFRYLNSLMGIWAWTTLFLSFVVYDSTTTTPAELILLVPVLAEIWVLLSVFDFAARRDISESDRRPMRWK